MGKRRSPRRVVTATAAAPHVTISIPDPNLTPDPYFVTLPAWHSAEKRERSDDEQWEALRKKNYDAARESVDSALGRASAPQCIANTRKMTQCTRAAKDGKHCGVHAKATAGSNDDFDSAPTHLIDEQDALPF
jgi:hypothetical protein